MTDTSNFPSRRNVMIGLGTIATGSSYIGSSQADALKSLGAPADAVATELPQPPASSSGSGFTTKGQYIDVTFDFDRCIHARYCVLWAPLVFRANVTPWIDADAERAEDLAAVLRNCPSGALRYTRHDGGPQESPPPVNILNVRENGPLAVRAEMMLDGKPIGYRATLCRCGASKHKPFCDRSHVEVKFVASGEVDTVDSPVLERRNGPLAIVPVPNGPVIVSGNLEICCGTGRTIKRTTSEILCRCGHSGNKPFCDGSHLKVGFSTE